MIIKYEDVKEFGPGNCRKGIMKFFNDHDLDFRDFLINGIDSQKLLDTNDTMAITIVEGILNGRKQ